MPILVATLFPGPDPGDGGTTTPTDTSPFGPKLTWTSADGRVTDLLDFGTEGSGMFTMPGVLGLGMPGYTFYEDSSPAFDGATVRGVPRARPRDITVPVHIYGPSRAACLARWRQFVYDLNPQNGPGVLTLHEPDGTTRSIEAYYSQGIDGTCDDDQTGTTWMSFAAVFHASRPYWSGDVKEREYRLAAPGATFFPILPLVVTDSSPGGEVQLTNGGDTDCFPVWTIVGPATSVTLTNATTGLTLTVDYTLTDTDTLVIDTRDGRKTAVLNGVTNLWPYIDVAVSSMWPLRSGLNDLVLAAPAATDHTSITAAWAERYLTAY